MEGASERTQREHHRRALSLAQAIVYVGRVRLSAHSRLRESQGEIAFADAEAAILSADALVVGRDTGHPEGVTYRVRGRRANGDMSQVVVAFNDEEIEAATELRVVTVMYPERGAL